MSNFTFLESRWGDLAGLEDLSEKYVYSDPNISVMCIILLHKKQ